MSVQHAGAIAGAVSTVLFVGSYLPMLARARRTRDLRSYSPGNLVVANLGNLVHTLYVVTLPVGPIWALHGFHLVSTAVMLWWWLRYRDRPGRPPASRLPARSVPEAVPVEGVGTEVTARAW